MTPTLDLEAANSNPMDATPSESQYSTSTLTNTHEKPSPSTISLPQPNTTTTPRRTLSSSLDHIILNLAPSFWSLCMGTGISSTLLYNLPYNAYWLQIIGIIIFILNITIFVLLSIGNIARYTIYKGLFKANINHLLSSLFWGCLPMGFTTIVNMIAFVCAGWSYQWAMFTLGLWWINTVMSIFVNFGMVFVMFARHTHTPSSCCSAWLLPIVSSVVSAASGGVVAEALLPYSPSLAHSTILVSYVVWGTGVPLAMFVITLWIYRTCIEGLPAAGALPSLFLPLGPCGQGAFGIAMLGKVTRSLAYDYNTSFSIGIANNSTTSLRIADAVYAGGLCTAMVLWGLGFCWYTLGMVITIDHTLKHREYLYVKNFSIGWTSYTFPLGVFATGTTILASEFDSPAFRIIGTIISLQVVLNWMYVFVMFVWKGFNGSIWVAPEVAGYEVKRRW